MRYLNNKGRISSDDIQRELINEECVVFEVTEACNFKCEYCIFGDLYTDFNHNLNRRMSFETAKAVIDYLIELWNHSSPKAHIPVTSFGFYGGEPLLNFDLIKRVVGYLEESNINRIIRFNMTSNCYLLDRYMDFLAEKQFDLLISLDGDEEGDSYRKYQDGSPTFHKVYNNVKELQHKYPEYFKKYVSFNSVIHNKNSVQKTYHFIKKEFNKIPSFTEVYDKGIKQEQQAKFNNLYNSIYANLHSPHSNEDCDFRRDIFENDIDVFNMLRFTEENTGNIFKDYPNLLSDNDDKEYPPTGTCIPFEKKIFVTVDGRILPCERIDHKYYYGYVDKGHIHLDYEAVAKTYNNYLDIVQSECSACYSKTTCIQCLYKMDLDDAHTHCPYLMNKDEYQDFCKSCERYIANHPEEYVRGLESLMNKHE